MARTLLVAVVVFALGAVAYAGASQQPQTAKQEQSTRIEPVAVPTGDGAPVITDGVFTPGEWDDALKIAVADGVTLFLKEYRGVVFVGIRGAAGPSDLYLAPPGGRDRSRGASRRRSRTVATQPHDQRLAGTAPQVSSVTWIGVK